MKIALIQHNPKLNRSNLNEHISFIQMYKEEADLVLFSELSLSGYLLQDKIFEDYYTLEDFEEIKVLSNEVDILLGAALKEDEKIFNAALYFSKGALTHVHHKNHLPNYGMFEEARFFFKGQSLESFQTSFGEASVVVCEDLWNSQVIASLAQQKPRIIYVLASSPARDFTQDSLLIKEQWEALLKTTALLSGAYVVFCNRVGFEDGLGFWGGSSVITPKGELEKQLALFEETHSCVELNHALYKTQKMITRIN